MDLVSPRFLTGAALSKDQQERLSTMMTAVRKSDPYRSKEFVFNQAVAAFSKTAFMSKGRWIDRQRFTLNNGKGPVVIPSWSSLVDGQ